jgi:hypothetical protein
VYVYVIGVWVCLFVVGLNVCVCVGGWGVFFFSLPSVLSFLVWMSLSMCSLLMVCLFVCLFFTLTHTHTPLSFSRTLSSRTLSSLLCSYLILCNS